MNDCYCIIVHEVMFRKVILFVCFIFPFHLPPAVPLQTHRGLWTLGWKPWSYKISLVNTDLIVWQVKLVNIRNDDIADGNPKLTLGLIWTIILHFQVWCSTGCALIALSKLILISSLYAPFGFASQIFISLFTVSTCHNSRVSQLAVTIAVTTQTSVQTCDRV